MASMTKKDKSPAGGLTESGRRKARREGHHLQKPVTKVTTKKDAARRKSFCARMSGMKGALRKKNGKPTRKALALKRWKCKSAPKR
jgi:hypothetical protein